MGSLCENSVIHTLHLCTFLYFMLYFGEVNIYVYMPRKVFQCMGFGVEFLVQIPANLLTSSVALCKLLSFLLCNRYGKNTYLLF